MLLLVMHIAVPQESAMILSLLAVFLMPIIEKSKEFARIEGIAADRCYKSVDELIKTELALPPDKRMEVVSIVTPNALHYPFAKSLT